MAADKKEAASKQEALENALKKIEKDFGKGSIMRLGDAKAHMDIEVIPTGILPLDIALGVGGIPRGRIIEVYGPESSGKTTVTLHMIAEAQKNGGIAALRNVKMGTLVACAAGPSANTAELRKITESVVSLDTADSNTLKAFFQWVSASVSVSSQKIERGGKEADGLSELPPLPPEINPAL